MAVIEAVSIISLIASVLGESVQAIKRKYNYDTQMSIDEAERLINNSLTAAKSKGEQAYENLLNKLSHLNIVQSTPAIKRQLENKIKKVEREASGLRTELDTLDSKVLPVQQAIDKANDANVFDRDKAIEEVKEASNNAQKQIERFEQRL